MSATGSIRVEFRGRAEYTGVSSINAPMAWYFQTTSFPPQPWAGGGRIFLGNSGLTLKGARFTARATAAASAPIYVINVSKCNYIYIYIYRIPMPCIATSARARSLRAASYNAHRRIVESVRRSGGCSLGQVRHAHARRVNTRKRPSAIYIYICM